LKIKTKREVQGVKICSNPRIKAYSNIWNLKLWWSVRSIKIKFEGL